MKKPDFKWFENGLETRLYIQRRIIQDIRRSFEPFFYQTADHIKTQSSNESFSFYLFRNSETAAVASIHFSKDETGLISPARAPFGGIQCAETCEKDELIFFQECINDWFSKQAVGILKVKTAPPCYYPETINNLLLSAYEIAGYNIADKFVNYHIPVSRIPFLKIITSPEVRRLKKCKASGFRAGLYNEPDTGIIYSFIKESRETKGYLMSTTLEQLDTLIAKFPERCKIFVVTDENRIIALTVTVLVCERVLYNFLPADLSSYKSFSPMVYLINTVYDYCQKEKIEILDLGISLDNVGNEKPGLLKFKKNIGGEASIKISYEKVKTSNYPKAVIYE